MDRIGIAWFSEQEYARIHEMMRDVVGSFPAFYDQWREKTEDYERYWKRRGHLTVRVNVDLDDFLAWCSVRSAQPNNQTLMNYVHNIVMPPRRN
jgi:hypothetical protein